MALCLPYAVTMTPTLNKPLMDLKYKVHFGRRKARVSGWVLGQELPYRADRNGGFITNNCPVLTWLWSLSQWAHSTGCGGSWICCPFLPEKSLLICNWTQLWEHCAMTFKNCPHRVTADPSFLLLAFCRESGQKGWSSVKH